MALQKKVSIMMLAMLLAVLLLVCSNSYDDNAGVAEAAAPCQGTINALASACGRFASGSKPPDAHCCGVIKSIKPGTIPCLCKNIPPGISSSVISKVVHGCGVSGSYCGAH